MMPKTVSGPWEVLTAEMRRYEYDIGPTGQISYAAPSGYHDDCVMALGARRVGLPHVRCGAGAYVEVVRGIEVGAQWAESGDVGVTIVLRR